MISRSRNDGREHGDAEPWHAGPWHAGPWHAVPPLVALVLALATVLLGCGEQVIVGRESAARPPAEALIDAGSYGAQPPAGANAGSDDDDSDGDEDDSEEDELDEDDSDTDEANTDD